jgi:hypothetical protein
MTRNIVLKVLIVSSCFTTYYTHADIIRFANVLNLYQFTAQVSSEIEISETPKLLKLDYALAYDGIPGEDQIVNSYCVRTITYNYGKMTFDNNGKISHFPLIIPVVDTLPYDQKECESYTKNINEINFENNEFSDFIRSEKFIFSNDNFYIDNYPYISLSLTLKSGVPHLTVLDLAIRSFPRLKSVGSQYDELPEVITVLKKL